MTGLSHDVLKTGIEAGAHKMHIFAAYNQNSSVLETGGSRYNSDLQPYKSLVGAWYHFDIPKFPLGMSLLFVNIGVQSVREDLDDDVSNYQNMAGGFLSFHPERWSVEAAYYHQWGEERMGIPLDAWMASAKAKAALSGKWSVQAGYDYLSGEEDFAAPSQGQIGLIHHEKVRGFTSLYGSNHQFYGAMDFFYVSTYVYGFTPGLQNLYAGLTWKPGKLSLDAAYHYFSTSAPIENSLKSLGQEVEFSATWSVGRDVSLSAGYSFMQGTETMSRLKRTTDKNRLSWAWLMLQVTPTFFKGKW